MLLYDIDDHPFLTPKSQALESEILHSHQLLAETLLGLSAYDVFSDQADIDQVELAIAMQINFQVEQGLDPYVSKSVSSGQSKQSTVYRDGYLDPRAVAIVDGVVTALGLNLTNLDALYSEEMVSHRGPNA